MQILGTLISGEPVVDAVLVPSLLTRESSSQLLKGLRS
jgi:hypothetical protein